MRKPRNRSDSSRLPTGLITIAADAAFAINGVKTGGAINEPGVRFGSVVVCSVESIAGQSPGIIVSACCPADGVVFVDCVNASGVIFNLPDYVVRWMVLPH